MANTQDNVARLWALCHALRDDGITYHQYVTELTYLLFLKMAAETGAADVQGGDGSSGPNIPSGCRWSDLISQPPAERLDFYRAMLFRLGSKGSPRVRDIFRNAQTSISRSSNLSLVVDAINTIDWYSSGREGLGDAYEGILDKHASEKKSGAGQYFTPRPLIDCMVALIQPQVGEIIQDPAAGTGGFLVAADRYVKNLAGRAAALTRSQQAFQATKAFQGMELVPDTHRLGLMNLLLHGIESDRYCRGDALSPDIAQLDVPDVILTNPPFGAKKGGGNPTRTDLRFKTANKQLSFLQHVYRALPVGGRAAVVVSDNVLFEDGAGREVRSELMSLCRLHTILKLPTGIFYAQGVKTNVLFLNRDSETNTEHVWIYDMRANSAPIRKRRPLAREDFISFELAFGTDPHGRSPRTDQGESGRFRCFTRDEILARGDDLSIAWLRDDTAASDSASDPGELCAEIIAKLRAALDEMEELSDILDFPPGSDPLSQASNK
ncbi:SAM-dependent methyltransferase [Dankookia rubra]|uniref:site-specific DNA-methyltransferase (adenine-specific) n=1 Tax=Dankookia rubra TaxID=1442381 RepID=A0A4R5QIT2_9PROT|nr:N-6 DNA methylase [Dankookia rubra]TDH63312.1 SAM-dependent methyltransferase [Dankookia rubra]